MNLEKLNTDIEKSNIYQFMIRHKKVINVVQGFFIIGLLIGINMYVYQDHQIKKQIKDHCGYTTSNFECVCEKNFVDDWKAFQDGDFKINLSNANKELPKAESIVEFLPTRTQEFIKRK